MLATACGGGNGGDGDSGTGSTGGPATDASADDDVSDPTTMTAADDDDRGSSDASTGSADDSTTGAPVGTAGCGLAPADPSMQWVAHTIDVNGMSREYWLWLPMPYDPQRAYPVVYQWHGCSDGEDRWTNNPPVQDQSGADAIHIRGKAVASCWDTGIETPDLAFFDALVAETEATLCADPARRFATGYSSGAFMTHRLGCARGDMLRGIASIAGGQADPDCTGPVAALLIHDENDSTVQIGASIGARDAHLARNGCDATAPTSPVDPAPCQAYAGCDEGLPVVWCQTSGQDHSRQDGLAAPAFWNFLSALPNE